MRSLNKLVQGQKVTLTVTGTVIETGNNVVNLAIDSILGKRMTQGDALNTLVGINASMLNELRQLPKVMPLGET